MRYNIQGVARSTYGGVLPYNDIDVYFHGTDILADVYDTKTSTIKTSTIQTDENGKFQIYFDSDDYENLDITFDLEIDNNRLKDIEVFKIDERIINTNEDIDGDNIKEVINNIDLELDITHIDGGTF